MIDFGKQYEKHDNQFKKQARLHQSQFRENTLKVDFEDYGNRLKDCDAKKMINYYDDFGIHEAKKKRYPNYSKKRDADLLRSEHIPFNIFSPLANDYKLAKTIFNSIHNFKIQKITNIEIEYAPAPKSKHLEDSTSFDTYVEFINGENEKCGIGIEVKYTEGAYSLKKGSSEYNSVNDMNSVYYKVTNKSKKFKTETIELLKKNEFRQIWRNHILGESMGLDVFYSMTLYPKGNNHFSKALQTYKTFLIEEFRNRIIDTTFEVFFETLEKNSSQKYKDWVSYLNKRYLWEE